MIKRELASIYYSIVFFTRIPVKIGYECDKKMSEGSVKYLPMVGWITGGISALILWAGLYVFPLSISVVLSMLAGILITGAFHEDGLADVCDGFGGGTNPERILEIMKDSHIGTYGVTALIIMFLLKFLILIEIDPVILPIVIIAAHSLSRFSAVSLMMANKYVRHQNQSKILPVIGSLSLTNILVAAVFGIAPLVLLGNFIFFLILLPVLLGRLFIGIYFKKKIGGYTGDCLGATQQLSEIIFYLSFYLLWKFI